MNIIPFLLLASLAGSNGQETRLLFDFDATDSVKWTTVHDTVMGGRSDGRISLTDDGTLRFRGNISLENNGGFTSFRSRSLDLDLEDSEGVELRVKGDGRTYIFSTERSDVALFGGGYWQRFETEEDSWIKVRLPWDAFVPTSFGNVVKSAPKFDPAMLTSMGVYLYDKKAGPFDLQIDSISAYYLGGEVAPTTSYPDDYATVLSLVQTLGLDKELENLDGAFTLFAPSDKAFQALPDGVFQQLARPENTELLRDVLLYHVVPARYPAAKAVKLNSANSLQKSALKFAVKDGELKVNQATVIETDLEFAGGVVHAIDQVLVPVSVANKLSKAPSTKSTLVAESTTVFALIEAAGLEEVLAKKDRYTLFAPTDHAFAALDPAVVEALLMPENIDALRSVLLRHVVNGGVTAYSALQLAQSVPQGNAVKVEALDGYALDLRLDKSAGLSIGGSKITRTDILAGNAVIHVIDQVLVPADLKLASADPITSFLEGVVARGVKDFNSGNVEACATGYRTALEALSTFGSVDDQLLQAAIDDALEVASQQPARNAAWTLRAAIDKLRRSR